MAFLRFFVNQLVGTLLCLLDNFRCLCFRVFELLSSFRLSQFQVFLSTIRSRKAIGYLLLTFFDRTH